MIHDEIPMPPSFKQMTDFFRSLGADEIGHTDKTYLAHAIGVYRDLEEWGCDEELCQAGMFHSIYGTQKFQKFALPLERRPELCDLIGARAERIAFVNCVMDRPSFDRAAAQPSGPYQVLDRLSGQVIDLTSEEMDDLCRVHLCDWLEQVPRSKEWDYRRAGYRTMAERLGGVALESYDRVFGVVDGTAR